MLFFQIVETRHALSLHQTEETNGKQTGLDPNLIKKVSSRTAS